MGKKWFTVPSMDWFIWEAFKTWCPLGWVQIFCRSSLSMLFLDEIWVSELAKHGIQLKSSAAGQTKFFAGSFGCMNLTLTLLCSTETSNTIPTPICITWYTEWYTIYDRDWFVGIVLHMFAEHNEVRVKFMHPKRRSSKEICLASDRWFQLDPSLAHSKARVKPRNNIDRELLQILKKSRLDEMGINFWRLLRWINPLKVQ